MQRTLLSARWAAVAMGLASGALAFPPVRSEPATYPRGLLLAASRFSKASGSPPASELTVLTFANGGWRAESVRDPASLVLHKALPWPGVGIVTLGGMRAEVALWRPSPSGLERVATLWSATFGGVRDRLRDGELGDLDGTGQLSLAIATHDQGVVGVLRTDGFHAAVIELDRKPNTWVHEIELGDLDGDGVIEIYATPSAPNALGGAAQRGVVTRYVPGRGEGRRVVADFGERHAKEILVADLDGDSRDELYAAVEPFGPGPVEILRFDWNSDPHGGAVVATLPDRMCRFLTIGDVDGDGRREIVLAPRDSGVWLGRIGAHPRAPWALEHVDPDSSSFEHAALLADLDGDGADELYVADDRRRQLRRYVWDRGQPRSEVIYRVSGDPGVLTWNITSAPLEMLR